MKACPKEEDNSEQKRERRSLLKYAHIEKRKKADIEKRKKEADSICKRRSSTQGTLPIRKLSVS